MYISKITKILRTGLLALMMSLTVTVVQAQTEFKMITLQHRFAQDILPTIEPLVGEEGTASGIDNHLMIRATPERLQAIEQVIATLDTARRNVRITVSHEDASRNQRSRAGVSGSVHSGDVEVQTSPHAPDGVIVDIGSNQSNRIQSGTEFVTVLDGERAFIRVGQSVPYTQQWIAFTQRYASVQQTTEFRDITTGFAVRPRYVGNEVELEITPRITRMNQSGFIDFEELSTVVRVRPGQSFDLGGTMQSRDDVSRAILSGRNTSGSRSSSLSIKVD